MNGQNQEKLSQNLHKKNITEAADHLLEESKKLVGDMYDDGLKKVDTVKKEAQDYTEELMEQVRDNPLKSVLIAGGIGFLLSVLLKK